VTAANLDHVITVALGINGLCTGHVTLALAAESIPRSVFHEIESTVGLEYPALELQVGPRTAVESVPTSQVVAIVPLMALFGNTLTRLWGRSSNGKAGNGGQDGK